MLVYTPDKLAAKPAVVLGLTFFPNVTDDPITGWEKIVYGDRTQLVGYEVKNRLHIPAFQGDATLKFFGLL